MIKANLADFFS